jgi:hypothetical protein
VEVFGVGGAYDCVDAVGRVVVRVELAQAHDASGVLRHLDDAGYRAINADQARSACPTGRRFDRSLF